MTFPHVMSLDEIEAAVSQPTETPNNDGQNGTTPQTTPTQPAAPSQSDALREALRISEEARLDLAARLNNAQPNTQQQQQPQQERWFTREEIAQMLNSDDPVERLNAMEINTNQSIRLAAQHFEQRLAPLTAGSLYNAQSDAERRYPLEYSLFKDEINNLVNNLPDKSQLTTASGWDNLISFVRGRPGNIDKYVGAVTQRQQQEAQQQARQSAVLNTPFSPTPTNAPVLGSQQMVVDDVTRQIAKGLGYDSVDAYLKDYNLYNKNAYNG